MHDSVHFIRVFIGSPGDVMDERRCARSVVEEVNKTTARHLGIQLELVGWEDTLPGGGRPQELINRDVDQCDIFLGLLWKRWGTNPGGDAGFTSGFEEEFERAMKRRRDSSYPQIWMAFKHVDPDSRADPGFQLQQVLAFRRRQELAREVLFKEFMDIADWERKLREWLSTFVVREGIQRHKNTAASDQGTGSAVPTDLSATEEVANSEPLPVQIIEVSRFLETATKSGQKNYVEKFTETEEFSVIRQVVMSRAWLSLRFTNERLTTHETNTAYRYRARLSLVYPELEFVFRTIVGDGSDLDPGWIFFVGKELDEIARMLFDIVRSDSDSAVRIGALSLLRASRRRAEDADEYGAILSAISSETDSVVAAAFEYLGAVCTPEDSILFRSQLPADVMTNNVNAQTALARVDLKADPNSLLSFPALEALPEKSDFANEIRLNATRLPGGHLKFPHLRPPQTPPLKA